MESSLSHALGPAFAVSPTLAINERVAERRRAGADVVHLGFGEAGLPVHPLLRDALASAAHMNAYGAVGGSADLREAVAGWFGRRALPTDPDAIVAMPGSKAGLFGLLLALPGDVVLPCPSWVSYAPQARLLGKRVIGHPVPEVAGGIPDPGTLAETLARHRRDGLEPGILVLTIPDNPTGSYPSGELVARVVEVARDEGLAIIVDEIYRELAYEPEQIPSIAVLAPQITFVTTGLSKALALGGWRFGVVRVPSGDLGEITRFRLHAIGSEVWSCVAAPVAAAAELAYTDPPELTSYVDDARAIHRLLCTTVHQAVVRAGLICRPPQAAFYLYPGLPDDGDPRTTDAELAERLLEAHGIAVLPGSAFGDDPLNPNRRFRISTSLLCGADDEERWETLRAFRSGELLRLPRITAALERIETALIELAGDVGRADRGRAAGRS